MHWLNLKSIAALVAAALVAGTATHVIQQHETNRVRQENQELLAKQAGLTKERDDALAARAAFTDQTDTAREAQSELMRLRNEVGRLRGQAAEVTRLREENQKLRRPVQVGFGGGFGSNRPSPESADPERDQCINNRRQIDGASQQYALEHNLTAGDLVTGEQITNYLRGGILPTCPSGGTYSFGSLTNFPTCSIPGHALLPSAETIFVPTSTSTSVTLDQIPAGQLNFQNVTFGQMLPVYKALSGKSIGYFELDQNIPALITLQTTNSLPRAEVLALMEQAFLEQAGIETVHVSANQVTFRPRRR